MITIDSSATVSELADIEDSVRGTLISIGPYTSVDAFVKIKPTGGSGDASIGAYCSINSGVTIYTGNGVLVGDNVLLAANVVLAPTNHAYGARDRLIREQGFKASRGGIVIGDDVWIGANSTVLDGARIPKGCVIGAGSVVSSELCPYHIYGGNPLRVLGIRK